MTQAQDASESFMAQMQAGFAEWQSRFQQMMKDFQEGSPFQQKDAARFNDWQKQWMQTIVDYEEKAKPYVDDLIQSLKRLADSTPEPWKQWAESAVSLTDRSIRAQQDLLERLAQTGTLDDKSQQPQ